MAVSLDASLPSGYDYDFLSEVSDEYICAICVLPMRRPVQTTCGHRFCKDCLCEANRRRVSPECPVDRQQLHPEDVFEDKAAGRTILSFPIKCPNQGCQWRGGLSDLKEHKPELDYKLFKCTNEGCAVIKTRIEITNHTKDVCEWREVSCPHCKTSTLHRQLEDHLDECPQCLVSCPNGCGEQITRETLADHSSSACAMSAVECPYRAFGCNFETQRKDLDEHLHSTIKGHSIMSCELLQDVLDNELRWISQKKINNVFFNKIDHVEEQSTSFFTDLETVCRENKMLRSEVRNLRRDLEQQSVKHDRNLSILHQEKINLDVEMNSLRSDMEQRFLQHETHWKTVWSNVRFYLLVCCIVYMILLWFF